MHFQSPSKDLVDLYADALTAWENRDRDAWVRAHCAAGDLARREFEKDALEGFDAVLAEQAEAKGEG